MHSSKYWYSFTCTSTCRGCGQPEGYLVTCMSHYIVLDCAIHMHVPHMHVCHVNVPHMHVCHVNVRRYTIKLCGPGNQIYLVLTTVGYPTCSDKWRPDKWHSYKYRISHRLRAISRILLCPSTCGIRLVALKQYDILFVTQARISQFIWSRFMLPYLEFCKFTLSHLEFRK